MLPLFLSQYTLTKPGELTTDTSNLISISSDTKLLFTRQLGKLFQPRFITYIKILHLCNADLQSKKSKSFFSLPGAGEEIKSNNNVYSFGEIFSS